MLDDEVLDSKSDLVGSDGLEYDHLLEGVESAIPVTRKGSVLRLNCIEELLELLVFFDEVLIKALERLIKVGGVVDLRVRISPLKITEPISGVSDDITATRGSGKKIS